MNMFVGEDSKIRWGAVIAGAAIATGVALVAPVMIAKFPEMGSGLLDVVGKIGEKIGDLILGMLGKTPGGVSDATVEAVKKLAGAGLIGGGVAYFMGGRKQPYQDPALQTAPADESFAIKEDMRKMQGLMVARAAAAGNPQAQAMLSQNMGRV